jgi:hypothetical protein
MRFLTPSGKKKRICLGVSGKAVMHRFLHRHLKSDNLQEHHLEVQTDGSPRVQSPDCVRLTNENFKFQLPSGFSSVQEVVQDEKNFSKNFLVL